MAEAYGLSSKSDENDDGDSLSLHSEESFINHPIDDDNICQGRPSPVGSESVSGYIVITASRRFQSQVNIIPTQEATRI